MIAYKLFRELKSGELRPLFIDRKRNIIFDWWLNADLVITKGFKERKGWHCTSKPIAPHLSLKNRVWCIVEILDYEEIKRPISQGGTWYIAQKMKVISKINIKN